MTEQLTDQQLDELEQLIARTTPVGAVTASPGLLNMLVDEVRRLRADAADALLPDWEAMYEPGNVSNYLIGYANDEAAAKGAAEAWLRSQAEVTGRLEWQPWGTVTDMPDGYDAWFELAECHDDGIDTGPGIVVRRRVSARAAEESHVVADDSDDPEHVDDCPGCEAANAGVLPEWLYERFARYQDSTSAWSALPDDERSYWEHQAAAVRRAVARSGFRTTTVVEGGAL